MRTKFSAILILVVFFIQCKNNNDSNNLKNSIGDEQMISLLTEIHLVEGSIAPMLIQGDSATQYILDNYEFLFKKYHTSRADFQETMKFYVQHPKQLDEIYEKVIENLSKMQSEIRN